MKVKVVASRKKPERLKISSAVKLAAVVGAIGLGGVVLNNGNVLAESFYDSVTVNPVYQQYMADVAAGNGKNWRIVPAKYIASSSLTGRGGDAELPNSYSLLDSYATTLKNQGQDGDCWAYAMSTAIESNLKKTQGTSIEFSPKQIDYMFASTSYADYIESKYGAEPREIGDGGNFYYARIGLGSQYLPVEENVFFKKMQANDEILKDNYSSFREYNDYSAMYGFGAYDEEMAVSDILGETNYTVTEFSYYDGGTSDLVERIKQDVYNTGAVSVSTYAPETENCWDEDSKTIIDKGAGVCNVEMGHAMSIVGWDDNYSYKDGDTTKQGVFILQNSWGKSSIFEDYETSADDILDYYEEIGFFEGKDPDGNDWTDASIAAWKNEFRDDVDSFDAMETVYLGYDFETTSSSTINFGAITKVQKNTWDNIYDETMLDSVSYGDTMKDSWEIDELQEVNAASIHLFVPQRNEITFNIAIYGENSGDEAATTSITFAAGESGQKFVELEEPISVSGKITMVISVDDYVFEEGDDSIVLARAYAVNDDIAVPNTGLFTGEDGFSRVGGVVVIAFALATGLFGIYTYKNRRHLFHKINFGRKEF